MLPRPTRSVRPRIQLGDWLLRLLDNVSVCNPSAKKLQLTLGESILSECRRTERVCERSFGRCALLYRVQDLLGGSHRSFQLLIYTLEATSIVFRPELPSDGRVGELSVSGAVRCEYSERTYRVGKGVRQGHD